MMYDTSGIFIVILTFLVAGTVKGVIGLGLPTISLAILTVVFGLSEGMALLIVPSFLTNLWQALSGGYTSIILRRLYIFLLAAACSVFLGANIFMQVDPSSLSTFLGVLLMVYGLVNLANFSFLLNSRQVIVLAPLAGALNGIFTGMTGSMVVPGVMFLQALGLHRDMLIQAMGMLFTLSTGALALAMYEGSLLTLELGAMSSLGLVPALVGMALGQRIRKILSEAVFKRIFFLSNLVIGAYIVASNQLAF